MGQIHRWRGGDSSIESLLPEFPSGLVKTPHDSDHVRHKRSLPGIKDHRRLDSRAELERAGWTRIEFTGVWP